MDENRRCILCVDDDGDFLLMYRKIFESAGYEVVCCSDSREALEKMSACKPALVLTDLMMSSIDSGFSFSRAVKEDPRFADIPVIIVTAIGGRRGFDFSPRSGEDLADMHADAYFDKPADPGRLVAKVEELLQKETREGRS
jgi:CheY-like chemotaxis protein